MWAHNMKCVKRVKESALPSGCVSWGNMLPRSMVKIKECRECVFPTHTHTSVSHSPQGFNYGLPSPLISTSRPLILNVHAHTHAQTHKQSGAHIWNQMEHSEVYHTHTDTHTANSHMFHVELCKHGIEVSHVSVTCVKGHQINTSSLPSFIFIIFYPIQSVSPATTEHLFMIDGVNYRRLMFHCLSQSR